MAGERPADAASWKEPSRASKKVNDACVWNKRLPNKKYIRKPTRVKGTAELCAMIRGKCRGDHEHQPIQGSIRIGGQRMNMSEWAGSFVFEVSQGFAERGGTGIAQRVFHRHEMSLGLSDTPHATHPAGNAWGQVRSNRRR